MLAVVLFWLLPTGQVALRVLLIAVLFVAGALAAAKIEQWSKVEDNPIIVIDEVVGMLVTLLVVEKTVKWLAIGFILFRLFDIIKPFPARAAESIPGGWGVMMDDVVAGVYALICLQGLYFLFSNVSWL